MENNHIPIIEFSVNECKQIGKNDKTIECSFIKTANPEAETSLGKSVYLTLDGTWLGCFVLEEITHLEGSNTQFQYTNIESALLKNNQLLANQLESLDNYPFTLSGFEEGSIDYYNQTPTELLCFPLIGYQQWPLDKPTNLPIDLLPPAVRINPLLQSLSKAIGIDISPLSEELVLPYFGNQAINWPWQTLAAINFEVSNALGLSLNSELGTITEAHTSVAKVYKTTFLSNYSVQTTVNLTLENNGNSSNTGLFYINITDPSQVLLKQEAILSYEVEANSSQTYTLNLEGDGVTNDLFTITLVPDNTFVDLNYSIAGTIIPQTNEGIVVSQLLDNITVGELFQLIENTTGKQWQWNQFNNTLELVMPTQVDYDLPIASKTKNEININFNERSYRNNKLIQINRFNQYLHLSTVTAAAIQLPSTKNLLPSPSEIVSYSQPTFLVKVPESSQQIKLEGYTITSFVPVVLTLEDEKNTFTKVLQTEGKISVQELGNLIQANKVAYKQSPFQIQSLQLNPTENNTMSFTLKGIA